MRKVLSLSYLTLAIAIFIAVMLISVFGANQATKIGAFVLGASIIIFFAIKFMSNKMSMQRNGEYSKKARRES